MSEDGNGKDYRPQRRHSIERYRPGARNRQDEDYGEDLPEQLGGMSIREDKGRGRGRGKLPLAPRDLRNKLNEIRKNAPPLDQHHYINSNNINIHSNYHRNNNHHRNDNRYHYPKGRGKQGQQNEDRREDASGSLPLVTRNTECFEPSYEPPDMRILFAQPDWKKYERKCSTRDVIMVTNLFGSPDDKSIYDSLLCEIEESGIDPDQLWQSWHGDSHLIADDKKPWKKKCPTFSMVIDKIADYFKMDVKATRFNWYRDSSEWKPYHHDAAAVKYNRAKTQNFTAGVSFGTERDAAFQHAKTKTVVSLPQSNGCVYTFGRDVNILWRHGIPQVSPEDEKEDGGRISIILWGWIDQHEL
ncbi:uncharacterized protein [Lepeophtheirus salmonis]|uniref:uncharacterized protein n=1 Tax=Lepeophtheirus salmonis TaxID=72036 RepID=UPI001AE2CCC3|nr:uncharacterized protein LOC121125652 [Lepeophtheirus salmonis]